jgi:hypothetical protein
MEFEIGSRMSRCKLDVARARCMSGNGMLRIRQEPPSQKYASWAMLGFVWRGFSGVLRASVKCNYSDGRTL